MQPHKLVFSFDRRECGLFHDRLGIPLSERPHDSGRLLVRVDNGVICVVLVLYRRVCIEGSLCKGCQLGSWQQCQHMT